MRVGSRKLLLACSFARQRDRSYTGVMTNSTRCTRNWVPMAPVRVAGREVWVGEEAFACGVVIMIHSGMTREEEVPRRGRRKGRDRQRNVGVGESAHVGWFSLLVVLRGGKEKW